ncbi:MAG: hypothetical protein ACNA8W_25240, partial [Bradymonadaceae bacterium]
VLAAPEKPHLHPKDCFELFDIDPATYFKANYHTRGGVCDESEEGLRHYLASIPDSTKSELANGPVRKIEFGQTDREMVIR